MAGKSALTCPDCGHRLYFQHKCRANEPDNGRECERVRYCPGCGRRYLTRETVTRKLPE